MGLLVFYYRNVCSVCKKSVEEEKYLELDFS